MWKQFHKTDVPFSEEGLQLRIEIEKWLKIKEEIKIEDSPNLSNMRLILISE